MPDPRLFCFEFSQSILEPLYRSGGFFQGRFFLIGKNDFDHLFHAIGTEFDRDTDEQTIEAVFTFKVSGGLKMNI